MTAEKAIEVCRASEPVPDSKFDNHMKKARTGDIESKKRIFCQQVERALQRGENIKELKSSIY